jgi:hypothetical protein
MLTLLRSRDAVAKVAPGQTGTACGAQFEIILRCSRGSTPPCSRTFLKPRYRVGWCISLPRSAGAAPVQSAVPAKLDIMSPAPESGASGGIISRVSCRKDDKASDGWEAQLQLAIGAAKA